MIHLESEIAPKEDMPVEGSFNGIRRDALRAHVMARCIRDCAEFRSACPPGKKVGVWFAEMVEEEIAKTLKRWGWEYP